MGAPEESHECSDMNLSEATASQPLEGLDAMHSTGSESLELDSQALDSEGWWCIEAFCIGWRLG